MKVNEILSTVSKEAMEVCSRVSSTELEQLAQEVEKAESIFIYGNGRSGLVGKMVAMRLMHSGYRVHVVGETTTPALEAGDLLIVLSGSGKGQTVGSMTEKVADIGGRSALVTASPDEALKAQFDSVLFIEASTKNNDIPTIQPLGNQFDQSMHLILDAMVIHLNTASGKSSETLKSKHFNLE